ncbi:ImmA/IrrE family metallo-endopeptidase [Acinetobacter lwoffii]|jgi:HTH-type transcriptional regulator/antitoxin HigA|uniref:ImmA/IrrE family metallo-endopeptidase n=1 Tax=Acinetobacter lwoffii TaxID=28090 RepID=UPI0011DDDAC5|nr:ImmA/IrrE family metallo-endopeptidase [Acinetobacter lwoffii]
MLINDFQPNWIHSPGKIIAQFASFTNIDFQSLDHQDLELLENIKQEKVKIDSDNVKLLTDLLGGTFDFWINLQTQYDENTKRLSNMPVDPQFKEFKSTVKELKAENWLPSSNCEYLDQVNLKSFYGISEFSPLEKNKIISNNLGSKLKGIGQYNISNLNLATLIRKVEIEAQKQLTSDCASWNKDLLLKNLNNLKKFTKHKKVLEVLPSLQETLSQYGIALFFIKSLSKTPICGLAKFTNNNRAIIAITPKYNKDHIFWETLFHELGHLVLHEEDMIFCDESYEKNDKNSIEWEADQFMLQAFLYPIDPNNFHRFINIDLIKRDKLAGWKEICLKARELDISPSLLTGLLKKMGHIPYKYYTDRHYTLLD